MDYQFDINSWALTYSHPEGEDIVDAEDILVSLEEYDEYEYDTVPAVLKREEGWE